MSLALLLGLTWDKQVKSEGLALFMFGYCLFFDVILLMKIGGTG